MSTPSKISFSTRQAAALFRTEPFNVLAHVKRLGHFRGVVPRKGLNGRYVWPASQVREVLGAGGARCAPEDLASRLADGAGVEVDAAEEVADWLLMTSRCGPTPQARVASMIEDVCDVLALLRADLALEKRTPC
jgi:hypothetical protein